MSEPTASAPVANSQRRSDTDNREAKANVGKRYRSCTRVGNVKKQRQRKAPTNTTERRSHRQANLSPPSRNPQASSALPISTPENGPTSGVSSRDQLPSPASTRGGLPPDTTRAQGLKAFALK